MTDCRQKSSGRVRLCIIGQTDDGAAFCCTRDIDMMIYRPFMLWISIIYWITNV